MLPSTAGFIDPLLSTGFPLTLLGIQRLATSLSKTESIAKLADQLRPYAEDTRRELRSAARLIGSLYTNMSDFPLFRTLSLLYFAAASYSETTRRLGKPQLAGSYLLSDNHTFAPEFDRLLNLAQQALSAPKKQELKAAIYRLIDKYDVAGLCQNPSDHTYPVRKEDLYASAHKLGVTATDIEQLLQQSGYFAVPITR